MSTSSLTRQVDALEAHLGVLLLNRSTRKLTLTDAGESYYERVVRILEEIADANGSVNDMGGPLRGSLRVSMPVAFAQLHISRILPEFLAQHPGIELDVVLSDEMSNLVEARIDVAIRIGSLEPSSLIARRLAPLQRAVCASPAYLAHHGDPATPADLARHNCLSFIYGRGDRMWHFRQRDSEQTVRVAGSLRSNNSMLLRDAALDGCGVILMPTWLVGEDLASGRLRALLADWEASPGAPGAAIHAVYLPNRRTSRKVVAFIDFLAGHLGQSLATRATGWD